MIAHKGVPLNVGPPPRRIRESSLQTPASSVTGPSGEDNNIYRPRRHRSVPHKPVPPAIRAAAIPRMNRQKNKGFSRSPHLQAAIERNMQRSTTESKTPKSQAKKQADPEEIDQLYDLFSKYDDILGHLAKKNKRLKSFVKGETERYPGDFSASTIEVLETLEKLKLQREKFGLGQGLDVSSGLHQKGGRSRSATPRLRSGPSTTNARITHETKSSRLGRSSRPSQAHGERYSIDERSYSLERRKHTPPRFRSRRRGSNGSSSEEVHPRSKSNDRIVPGDEGIGALSKSFSNVSRGSNYEFRQAPVPKPEMGDRGKYKSRRSQNRLYVNGEDLHRSRQIPSKLGPINRRFDPISGVMVSVSTRSSEDPTIDDLSLLEGLREANPYNMSMSDSESETGRRWHGRYGESIGESERPPPIRHTSVSPPRGRDMATRERLSDSLEREFASYRLQQRQSFESSEDEIPAFGKPVSTRREDRLFFPTSPQGGDSRDEKTSPLSYRGSPGRSTLRTSPPRLELRKNRNQPDPYLETDEETSEVALASNFTPTRAPRKNFLPVSPIQRSSNYAGISVGASSYAKSLAPSEKARRLQHQVQRAYQSTQNLKESQAQMKEDLVKIKEKYVQRNGALAERVSKAMYTNLAGHGMSDDPIWAEPPETFNIIELEDGTLHLEDLPELQTKDSEHGYHIEDGVIFLDDGSELQASTSSPISIIHMEDHPEFRLDAINIDRNAGDDENVPMDGRVIDSNGDVDIMEDPAKLGHVIDTARVNHGSDSPKPRKRLLKKKPILNLDVPKRFSFRKREPTNPEPSSKSGSTSSEDKEGGTNIGYSTSKSDTLTESNADTKGNLSLVNPMVIAGNSSMIVQERPKRRVRNLGIREVVLRHKKEDKGKLRDIPTSLLSMATESVLSMADSVTTHTNDSVTEKVELEMDGLKEAIDDLRARPGSSELPLTIPDKKVHWDMNNGVLMPWNSSWNDHCGILPCGLAST